MDEAGDADDPCGSFVAVIEGLDVGKECKKR